MSDEIVSENKRAAVERTHLSVMYVSALYTGVLQDIYHVLIMLVSFVVSWCCASLVGCDVVQWWLVIWILTSQCKVTLESSLFVLMLNPMVSVRYPGL